MPNWSPTHRIHVRPRSEEADFVVEVMVVADPRPGSLRGYTEEEWRAQLAASWSQSGDGRWTWRGSTAPFGRLATVDAEEIPAAERGDGRVAQAPRHFLLVDDEPRVAQALLRALRPYARRWLPLLAADGQEALRQLAQPTSARILAVVSDRRMPGMDGIQLLREVQRLHPRVARLLLTGSGALRDHAVAQRVLRKPCPPSVLMAALDQAAATPQSG